VFREVKDVSKQEFLPMQDEPEKIELENSTRGYGLERNPLLNVLECLILMLMYMFQSKIGVSWIKWLKSVSLLVIKMV
jgi:hypothetical protein